MLLLEDRRFYVYIYLDPRKSGTFIYGNCCFAYEPFYVGKGMGSRLYRHLRLSSIKGSNKFKNNIIKILFNENLSPIILKAMNNLTEGEALHFEEIIVNLIGRVNKNNGPLTNMKPGGGSNLSGEWNPMYGRNDACYKKGGIVDLAKQNIGKTYEEIYGIDRAKEIKKKVSNASKGRIQTEEDRKKKSISNKKTRGSDERLRKISSENGKKNKGMKRTLEQRRYQSERQKGQIPWNKGIPVKDEVKNKISNTALENLIKRLDIDIIVSLYDNGMSVDSIAKDLKSSKQTINKMLKNPNKYRSYNKYDYNKSMMIGGLE